MKIALCFYGQPRFYDNQDMTYFLNKIRNEDNQVDVYMHLWKPQDSLNYLRSPWSNIDHVSGEIDVNNLEEKIQKRYNPIFFEIENEKIFVEDAEKYKISPSPTSPEIVHRMFYSQWRVGELLKKSNIQYDLVFKLRTDSIIVNIKDLKKCVNEFIWVPDNCPVMGWFNDNFSISSQENFYKLVNTYNNLEEFYKNGVTMNGEPMLRAQVRKEGIEKYIRKNQHINVGLIRKINPTVIQGVWIGEEFKQMFELQSSIQ